jgi:hypothetical protein
MEEVVSSNLTRSTKTFHRVSVSAPFPKPSCGVQLESLIWTPAAGIRKLDKSDSDFHRTSLLFQKTDISDKRNLNY